MNPSQPDSKLRIAILQNQKMTYLGTTYLLSTVTPGQLSVRNGLAGKFSLL